MAFSNRFRSEISRMGCGDEHSFCAFQWNQHDFYRKLISTLLPTIDFNLGVDLPCPASASMLNGRCCSVELDRSMGGLVDHKPVQQGALCQTAAV
jgi:hypothetical protein